MHIAIHGQGNQKVSNMHSHAVADMNVDNRKNYSWDFHLVWPLASGAASVLLSAYVD